MANCVVESLYWGVEASGRPIIRSMRPEPCLGMSVRRYIYMNCPDVDQLDDGSIAKINLVWGDADGILRWLHISRQDDGFGSAKSAYRR